MWTARRLGWVVCVSWVAQLGCGIGGEAPQALSGEDMGRGGTGAEEGDEAPPPLPDTERDLSPGEPPGPAPDDGAPGDEPGEDLGEDPEGDPGEGPGEAPEEDLGEGIFAEQREESYVLGDVTVIGDRFVVAGRDWYPKTDFLTAVAPGEDILDGNTHTYLGRGAHRRRIREALVGHGYNSIYVYTLNQGDYGAGRRGENVVTPYQQAGGAGGGRRWSFDTGRLDDDTVERWRAGLQELLAAGLKPFLWLAADDSPDIARADLAKWRRYVGHMTEAFDDLPVVWVLGLEVDEYWSAGEVRQRREAVQALTDRPVGVHLTTGETRRNRADYTAGFDFVMGQLQSPQGDEGYRQDVRELASDDRPWVAAEFNVRDRGGAADVTGRSKAIGRLLASVGDPPLVAGIGNGIELGLPDPPRDVDDEPDEPAGGDDGVPFDLADVTWLHADVSGWEQTATLREVRVTRDQICLDYDHADVWPADDSQGDAVVGNPWIFIEHDGRWWGATWEWLRPGQTCKNRRAVNGDHIKQDPFWEFEPRAGDTYGFMVSGLARSNLRNARERTNVVMFTWP